MKDYQTPRLEIVVLGDEDIVRTSGGLGTSLIEDEEAGWVFD